eukprot:6178268-Pleurochrysis_carterae.AAC.1
MERLLAFWLWNASAASVRLSAVGGRLTLCAGHGPGTGVFVSNVVSAKLEHSTADRVPAPALPSLLAP